MKTAGTWFGAGLLLLFAMAGIIFAVAPEVTITLPANGSVVKSWSPLVVSAGPPPQNNMWYSIDGGANTTGAVGPSSFSVNMSREYPPRNGTLFWWHFDEGTGQYANSTDNSFNFRRGGSASAEASDPSWATGRIGLGFNFTAATSQYAYVYAPYFNYSDYYTIEFWGSATETSTAVGFLGTTSWDVTYGIIDILKGTSAWWGTNIIVTYIPTGTGWFTPAVSVFPCDNVWRHVAFVYDYPLRRVFIYINGVLVSTQTNTNNYWIPPAVYDLRIGNRGDNNWPLNGGIDELRILNRALSPQEVWEDYALTAGAHQVGVWANKTGDIGFAESYFRVDGGAPSLSILPVASYGTPRLNATFSDENPELLSASVDGGSRVPLTRRTGTVDFAFLKPALADDFSGASSSSWSESGSWAVESGEYSANSAGDSFAGSAWSDYLYSLRFVPVTDGIVKAYFRYSDASNHYYLSFNTSARTLRLYGSGGPLSGKYAYSSAGGWEAVRVELSGSTASVFVNGKRLFAYGSLSVPSGKIGVGSGGAHVHFDEVSVGLPLSDGLHSLVLYANDTLGNNASHSANFTVNGSRPRLAADAYVSSPAVMQAGNFSVYGNASFEGKPLSGGYASLFLDGAQVAFGTRNVTSSTASTGFSYASGNALGDNSFVLTYNSQDGPAVREFTVPKERIRPNSRYYWLEAEGLPNSGEPYAETSGSYPSSGGKSMATLDGSSPGITGTATFTVDSVPAGTYNVWIRGNAYSSTCPFRMSVQTDNLTWQKYQLPLSTSAYNSFSWSNVSVSVGTDPVRLLFNDTCTSSWYRLLFDAALFTDDFSYSPLSGGDAQYGRPIAGFFKVDFLKAADYVFDVNLTGRDAIVNLGTIYDSANPSSMAVIDNQMHEMLINSSGGYGTGIPSVSGLGMHNLTIVVSDGVSNVSIWRNVSVRSLSAGPFYAYDSSGGADSFLMDGEPFRLAARISEYDGDYYPVAAGSFALTANGTQYALSPLSGGLWVTSGTYGTAGAYPNNYAIQNVSLSGVSASGISGSSIGNSINYSVVNLTTTLSLSKTIVNPWEDFVVTGHPLRKPGNSSVPGAELKFFIGGSEAPFKGGWNAGGWWNVSWGYRCNLTVSEPVGVSRYKQKLIVNASDVASACPDVYGANENSLRVVDDGVALPTETIDWTDNAQKTRDTSSASAPWWNSSYRYRLKITVNASGYGPLINENVFKRVDLKSMLNFTGNVHQNSTRVADADGVELPSKFVFWYSQNDGLLWFFANGTISTAKDYYLYFDTSVNSIKNYGRIPPPDVVMQYRESYAYRLIGNYNGGFPSKLSYDLGIGLTAGSYNAIGIADFDNDGYLDFVAARGGSSSVWLFKNNGTGNGFDTFLPPIVVANRNSTANIWDIPVADFNEDGNVDFITLSDSGSEVVLFTGNGNGTFSRSAALAINNNRRSAAVGDFDHDGNMDLMVGNYGGYASWGVYYGRGEGSFDREYFSGREYTPSGDYNYATAALDGNHDGWLDHIGGGYGYAIQGLSRRIWEHSTSITGFRGAGDPAFRDRGYWPNFRDVGNYLNVYGWMEGYDFNHDGKDDLVGNVYEDNIAADCGIWYWQSNGSAWGFNAATRLGKSEVCEVYGGAVAPQQGHNLGFSAVLGEAESVGGHEISRVDSNDQLAFLVSLPSGGTKVLQLYFDPDYAIPSKIPEYGLFAAASEDSGKIWRIPFDGRGVSGYAEAVADVGIRSRGVAVADFDNDGLYDIVSGNGYGSASSEGKMYFYRQLSNGSFASGVYVGTISTDMGDYLMGVRAGDFNEDGNMDFVAAGNNFAMELWLGNGDGTFTDSGTGFTPVSGSHRPSMDFGDLNGDGHLDIVLSTSDGTLYYYKGNGLGGFTRSTIGDCGGNVYGLAVADFDGDGKDDVVCDEGSSGGRINLWKGLGDGTVASSSNYTGIDRDNELSIDNYDFNKDGKQDLLMCRWTSDAVDLYSGNGDGTFQYESTIQVTSGLVDNCLGIGTPPYYREYPLSVSFSAPDGFARADSSGDFNYSLYSKLPGEYVLRVNVSDSNVRGYASIAFFVEGTTTLSSGVEPSLPDVKDGTNVTVWGDFQQMWDGLDVNPSSLMLTVWHNSSLVVNAQPMAYNASISRFEFRFKPQYLGDYVYLINATTALSVNGRQVVNRTGLFNFTVVNVSLFVDAFAQASALPGGELSVGGYGKLLPFESAVVNSTYTAYVYGAQPPPAGGISINKPNFLVSSGQTLVINASTSSLADRMWYAINNGNSTVACSNCRGFEYSVAYSDLGTLLNPGVSCLNILNDGYSRGDGIYWIDPDGVGGSSPFEAYCDMTTNGGGWTLVMNVAPADGNSVGYNNQNFWTLDNAYGSFASKFSNDYKSPAAYALSGDYLMIQSANTGQNGSMLGWRRWPMTGTRTFDSFFSPGIVAVHGTDSCETGAADSVYIGTTSGWDDIIRQGTCLYSDVNPSGSGEADLIRLTTIPYNNQDNMMAGFASCIDCGTPWQGGTYPYMGIDRAGCISGSCNYAQICRMSGADCRGNYCTNPTYSTTLCGSNWNSRVYVREAGIVANTTKISNVQEGAGMLRVYANFSGVINSTSRNFTLDFTNSTNVLRVDRGHGAWRAQDGSDSWIFGESVGLQGNRTQASQADFSGGVSALVSLASLPGSVLLAKKNATDYFPSGNFTSAPIDLGAAEPNLTTIEWAGSTPFIGGLPELPPAGDSLLVAGFNGSRDADYALGSAVAEGEGSEFVSGKAGFGLRFNGSAYLFYGTSGNFNGTSGAVGLWVRPEGGAGTHYFFNAPLQDSYLLVNDYAGSFKLADSSNAIVTETGVGVEVGHPFVGTEFYGVSMSWFRLIATADGATTVTLEQLNSAGVVVAYNQVSLEGKGNYKLFDSADLGIYHITSTKPISVVTDSIPSSDSDDDFTSVSGSDLWLFIPKRIGSTKGGDVFISAYEAGTLVNITDYSADGDDTQELALNALETWDCPSCADGDTAVGDFDGEVWHVEASSPVTVMYGWPDNDEMNTVYSPDMKTYVYAHIGDNRQLAVTAYENSTNVTIDNLDNTGCDTTQTLNESQTYLCTFGATHAQTSTEWAHFYISANKPVHVMDYDIGSAGASNFFSADHTLGIGKKYYLYTGTGDTTVIISAEANNSVVVSGGKSWSGTLQKGGYTSIAGTYLNSLRVSASKPVYVYAYGSTWQESLMHLVAVTPLIPSATVTSIAYDAGRAVDFNGISWNSTLPAGSQVLLQARTAGTLQPSFNRNFTEVNLSITEPYLDTFKFNWNLKNYTFYDPSLVLAMNFNNNSAIGESATKAVDISKYGNNGTLIDGNSSNSDGDTPPKWNSSGRFGSALQFDGVDDYVDVGNAASLNITDAITIEAWIKPDLINASGGTITFSGGYTIHTFTTSGTFVPGSFMNVEVLMVAGGGGGGMDMGGGGGGGGVIYNLLYPVAPQAYPITIGAGGAGAPAAGTFGQPGGHQYTIPARNGGNSVFGTLTAIGGGFGGSSYRGYTPGIAGNAGGSGGGSGGYNDNAGTFYGGAGTPGQGNRGGNSINAYYSGGGGGAGGQGIDSNARPDGGPGVLNLILGVPYYWGGGGGGASYSLSTGGNGGIGGGGGGAVGTTTGGAGLNPGSPGGGGLPNSQTNTPGGGGGANTGGGGGGGSHYNANNRGGDGGSGVVIVRYPTSLMGEGGLISKGPDAYKLNIFNSNITGFINGQAVSTPVTIGEYQHVALTYNGSTQRLYVNGILRTEQALTGLINASVSNLTIGNTFNGTIDEVRIYNRALTADEIKMHYQSEFKKYNGTDWGFYVNITNLNDAYSPVIYPYYGWVNDTAGNSYGTETRTVTIDPPMGLFERPFVGPDGTRNSFYNATPSGEALWAGHDGDRWLQYRAYLISNSYGTAPALNNVSVSANRDISLFSDSRGLGFSAGTCLVMSPSNWTGGEWHHVAGAYDNSAGVARLFVDGSLADYALNCSFSSQPQSRMAVGSFLSKVHSANATIDGLRVSGRPAGVARIKMQARTSPDNSSWSEWAGADGTSNTYYTNQFGEGINAPNQRFVQYRAFLETDDSLAGPELEEVSINAYYRPNGTLVSNLTVLEHAIVSLTPSYDSREQSGTGINLSVSVNGGLDWVPAQNGVELRWRYNSSNNRLQYKAFLYSSNSSATPYLDGISLSYAEETQATDAEGNFIYKFAAPDSFGNYNVTVRVEDSSGRVGERTIPLKVYIPTAVAYWDSANYSSSNTLYVVVANYSRTDTGQLISGNITIRLGGVAKSCAGVSACTRNFTVGPSGELRGGSHVLNVTASNFSAFYNLAALVEQKYVEEPAAYPVFSAPNFVIPDFVSGVEYAFPLNVTFNNTRYSSAFGVNLSYTSKNLKITKIAKLTNNCGNVSVSSLCFEVFNVTVASTATVTDPAYGIAWRADWRGRDGAPAFAAYSSTVDLQDYPRITPYPANVSVSSWLSSSHSFAIILNNTGNVQLSNISARSPYGWVHFSSARDPSFDSPWDPAEKSWPLMYTSDYAILNVTIALDNFSRRNYSLPINVTSNEGGRAAINLSIEVNPAITAPDSLYYSFPHGTWNSLSFIINSSGNAKLKDAYVEFVGQNLPREWLMFSEEAGDVVEGQYYNLSVQVVIPEFQDAGNYTGFFRVSASGEVKSVNFTLNVQANGSWVFEPQYNQTGNFTRNTGGFLVNLTLRNLGNVPLNFSIAYVTSGIGLTNCSEIGDAVLDCLAEPFADDPRSNVPYLYVPKDSSDYFKIFVDRYTDPRQMVGIGINVSSPQAVPMSSVAYAFYDILDSSPVVEKFELLVDSYVQNFVELNRMATISARVLDDNGAQGLQRPPGTYLAYFNVTAPDGSNYSVPPARISGLGAPVGFDRDLYEYDFSNTSLAGNYSILVYSEDSGGKASVNRTVLSVVDSSVLNVSFVSLPRAGGVTRSSGQALTLAVNLTNLGYASVYGVNLTGTNISAGWVLSNRSAGDIAQHASLLVYLNVTVPAATPPGSYPIFYNVTYRQPSGASFRGTARAAIAVDSNYSYEVTWADASYVVGHGSTAVSSFNVTVIGNDNETGFSISAENVAGNLSVSFLPSYVVKGVVGVPSRVNLSISAVNGTPPGTRSFDVRITSTHFQSVHARQAYTPPSPSWTKSVSNRTLYAVSGQEELEPVVDLANVGNVPLDFAFSVSGSAASFTAPSEPAKRIAPLSSHAVFLNYTGPNENGEFNGTLNLDDLSTPSHGNVSLRVVSVIARLDVLDVQPRADVIFGNMLNVTAALLYGDAYVASGAEYSVKVNGSVCVVASAESWMNGTSILCSAPSVPDGRYHDVYLKADYSGAAGPISVWRLNRSILYYRDVTPPSVSYVYPTPPTDVQQNATLRVTVSDNVAVDSVYAGIESPRGNMTQAVRLSPAAPGNYSGSVGGISTIGSYYATFYVNDTSGNLNSGTSIAFEKYEMGTFGGTLRTYEGDPVYARFILYEPGTTAVVASAVTDADGNYSFQIQKRLLDLYIEALNVTASLQSVDFTKLPQDFIRFDDVSPAALDIIGTDATGKVRGINVNSTISSAASVNIAYSRQYLDQAGYSEFYLAPYFCSDWRHNFPSPPYCASGFSKIKNFTINSASRMLSFSVPAFASADVAYAVMESKPEGKPRMELDSNEKKVTIVAGTSETVKITVKSMGEYSLTEVTIICVSGAACSAFNVSSSPVNAIAPGQSYAIPVKISVPAGYAASPVVGYEGTLRLVSNKYTSGEQTADVSLTVFVPELASVSISGNLSNVTGGSGKEGALGEFALENKGNVPARVLPSSTTPYVWASNGNLSVAQNSMERLSVFYRLPPIVSVTALNFTLAAGNASTVFPVVLNVTHSVAMASLWPVREVVEDMALHLNATADYGGALQEANVSWAVFVDESPCRNVSYGFYGSNWEIACSAPNVSARMNYTLILTGEFLGHGNDSVYDTAYDRQRIFYKDVFAPSLSAVVPSQKKNDGSNVTVMVDVYDFTNVSGVSLAIKAPDGTPAAAFPRLANVSEGRYSFTYNFTELGDYVLEFNLTDSLNNSGVSEEYFEVYEETPFYGQVRNGVGAGVPATFKFFRPKQGRLLDEFSTDSRGRYNITRLHKRTYDMEVSAFSRIKIRLEGVDLPRHPADILLLHYVNGTEVSIPSTHELGGVGVEAAASNYTGRITIKYEPLTDTKEDNIYVFKCDRWNFTSASCNSTWVAQSRAASDLNKVSNEISVGISGFSAYVAAESVQLLGSTTNIVQYITQQVSGGSGGGGGGGSAGGALEALNLSSIEEEITRLKDNLARVLSKAAPPAIDVDMRAIDKQLYAGESAESRIRVGNGANRTLSVTAEVLGNVKEFLTLDETSKTVDGNGEVDFMARVSVPPDAKAGIFFGEVVLSANNKSMPIPVSVRVLESKEKLLDLKVQPLADQIVPGSTLKVQADVYNLGATKKVDVQLNLQLISPATEKVISEIEEAVALETTLSVIKSLKTQPDLPLGRYLVKGVARYASQNSTVQASSFAYVEVMKPWYLRDYGGIMAWQVLAVLGIVAISAASIRIYKYYEAKNRKYAVTVDMHSLPVPGPRTAFIGNLAETGIRTFVLLDKLQTHTIVAGATGGGKTVAAQVVVEEALMKGVAVIVFDPTAQWSGFLRKCADKRMLRAYPRFHMRASEARSFSGNVRAIADAREVVDVRKFMVPGEINVFTLNRLDPKDIDLFVASTVKQIFRANLEESQQLKLLIVYDEVHRLLPKFGGSGEGFIQIERACREFRKWGVGLLLISQVLSDFIGAIKANIGTEIQVRSRDEGDLERIRLKYGEDIMRSILKASVGTGLVENSEYNKGRPYFVSFRPLCHSVARLSDKDLTLYNKYNGRIEDLQFQLEQLKELAVDVFDVELELKLAANKVKQGAFSMADIYIESIEPRISEIWKKLNKTPKKRTIALIDVEELKKDLRETKKLREEYVKSVAAAEKAREEGGRQPASAPSAKPEAAPAGPETGKEASKAAPKLEGGKGASKAAPARSETGKESKAAPKLEGGKEASKAAPARSETGKGASKAAPAESKQAVQSGGDKGGIDKPPAVEEKKEESKPAPAGKPVKKSIFSMFQRKKESKQAPDDSSKK